jgi:signal transduction histidine kinase
MNNRIFIFQRIKPFHFFLLSLQAWLFFPVTELIAQDDTTAVKLMYDRALDFDESKTDSIGIIADLIEKKSATLHFDKGELLSRRLRGIQAEYTADYEEAISQYLKCLELARSKKLPEYEESALSDLAFVYTGQRNPAKAKEFYFAAAQIAIARNNPSAIVTDLLNLGAICNQLHQPDSAIHYLEKANEVASRYPGLFDLTSLRNNFGNAWFQKKEWQKSLEFFRLNYSENLQSGSKTQIWYDVLNMADVYIELHKFDSASLFLTKAMQLARELASDRKQADVHQLYGKYYAARKDYRNAYLSVQQWKSIDSSLVNTETRQSILELEERFKAREREQANKLLQAEVTRQRYQTIYLAILALAVSVVAVIVGFSLFMIRRKNKKLNEQNELISRQNEKLAELNTEKNSLISIVSHDLSTPFSSIKMWAQLLEQEKTDLSENQARAVNRILSSTEQGEKLIRNILDIERVETNRRQIQIERIDLRTLLADTAEEQRISMQQKNILLEEDCGSKPVLIMSDRQLLQRVFGNLLSNAIKFTPHHKKIFLQLRESDGKATVTIRDEGVGISPEDQKKLFSKYGRLSSKPTGGEPSTGLGLSIVKRILDELNGVIICESEPGKGSVFRIELKK